MAKKIFPYIFLLTFLSVLTIIIYTMAFKESPVVTDPVEQTDSTATTPAQ